MGGTCSCQTIVSDSWTLPTFTWARHSASACWAWARRYVLGCCAISTHLDALRPWPKRPRSRIWLTCQRMSSPRTCRGPITCQRRKWASSERRWCPDLCSSKRSGDCRWSTSPTTSTPRRSGSTDRPPRCSGQTTRATWTRSARSCSLALNDIQSDLSSSASHACWPRIRVTCTAAQCSCTKSSSRALGHPWISPPRYSGWWSRRSVL